MSRKPPTQPPEPPSKGKVLSLVPPPKPPKAGKPGDRKKRERIDWQAVERDHGTGEYTLRELASRYNTDNTVIARRMKADRALDPSRWSKDIREAVRQATDHQVIAAQISRQVSNHISKAAGKSANMVLAKAEINAQVIIGHQDDVSQARQLVLDMIGELRMATALQDELTAMWDKLTGADQIESPEIRAAMQKSMRDLLSLHARGNTVRKLVDSLLLLHKGERIAHGMGDGEKQPEAMPPAPPATAPAKDHYMWAIAVRDEALKSAEQSRAAAKVA